MSVYKTTLRILIKNSGELLMAFGVTIAIMLLFVFQKNNYSDPIAKIAVISSKQSKLASSLTDYLGHQQQIVNIKNKSQKGIDDALFFETADYILYLPVDFETQVKSGHIPNLKSQVRPGSYTEELVNSDIDHYLNTLRVYQTKSTNLSWSSLLTKTNQTLNQKGTVKLDQSYNKREKQNKASVIYNLVAYGLFTVIFGAFTRIKLVFNRKVIRMRNKCSSLKQHELSSQINLGLSTYFILTSGMYLAIIFVFTQLKFNKATIWFMINAIIFIVSIITLSSWITSIFKNEHALNGFQNIYGLGTCFLGGVFVSSSILPNFVNKIACFTPVYWFTRNNNLIGETIKFDAKFFKSFTQSGLIIIGFALAFWTLEVLEERISITKYER